MTESLETGLILMIAGMGTVLALLAALVSIVGLVSRLCRRLEPVPAPVAAASPGGAAPKPSAAADELATVIGAAVKAHRDRHGASR
jgi:sodium pump decarboxylase gamma subunit